MLSVSLGLVLLTASERHINRFLFDATASITMIPVEPPSTSPLVSLGHARIDARSLALGRLVADRLLDQPALLQVAQKNLARWRQTCAPNTQVILAEWQEIIDAGVKETIAVLTCEDERSTRLRQSTPFAGEEIVTRAERNLLIRQFAP